MKATMSILALYNWDNTIFDNLTIPEGISLADLEMSLLMECRILSGYGAEKNCRSGSAFIEHRKRNTTPLRTITARSFGRTA